VRFVALGDAGKGNEGQRQVAQAMASVCAQKTDANPGCDFVLYLGDIVYPDGVSGVDDPLWNTCFVEPYQVLDVPFYLVMGNHDYGEASLNYHKRNHVLRFASQSEKWRMPDTSYAFEAGPVQFVGLDTTAIMLESVWGDSGQDVWLSEVMKSRTQPWTIAFGHHTYRSNGQHGSAGSYEGLPGFPLVSGVNVEEFMEENLCGQVDLYLAGHDHNRQWLQPQCGMELVVSGAGATVTPMVGRDVPTLFSDDSSPGFIWIEIKNDTLVGEFYNQEGVQDFRRVVHRGGAGG